MGKGEKESGKKGGILKWRWRLVLAKFLEIELTYLTGLQNISSLLFSSFLPFFSLLSFLCLSVTTMTIQIPLHIRIRIFNHRISVC